MFEIILLLVILLFMAGLALFRSPAFVPPGTKRAHSGTFQAFAKVESLFVNPQELRFFKALRVGVPKTYHVHSKVRLEDIVGVKTDIKNERMRWHLRARVKSRHVDFLITDLKGRPVCAIELDGPIHLAKLSENADALKDGIFEAIGLTLIRISTDEDFSKKIKEISERLSGF